MNEIKTIKNDFIDELGEVQLKQFNNVFIIEIENEQVGYETQSYPTMAKAEEAGEELF